MNIRPSSDLSQAAPVDPVRSERAGTPSGRASAAPSGAAAPGDRVELSDAARAAGAQPSAAQSPEVERARVALRAGSGLSPARLHELREQVRTGHYDQPEVAERVAEAAARDLGRAE